MKKTCAKCKIEKNIDEFNKKDKEGNSYKSFCTLTDVHYRIFVTSPRFPPNWKSKYIMEFTGYISRN